MSNSLQCYGLSLPGSSVCGVLQVRILEWVAMPFSRGSPHPQNWIQQSYIVGGFFPVWGTREALPLNNIVSSAQQSGKDEYPYCFCLQLGRVGFSDFKWLAPKTTKLLSWSQHWIHLTPEIFNLTDKVLRDQKESCSVVYDSLWAQGLYSPWSSPGQNTGGGSLSLLQGVFPTQGLNPGLLHCRQILYQLSHKGSPGIL